MNGIIYNEEEKTIECYALMGILAGFQVGQAMQCHRTYAYPSVSDENSHSKFKNKITKIIT